ncbi:unnamed protein product [Spodoptera exigua]|nr:unnamed protein product [Spodoptera exigua]
MTIFMAAWIFRSNLNYTIHKNIPSTFILAPNLMINSSGLRVTNTDPRKGFMLYEIIFVSVVSVTNVPSVMCIKLICSTCNSHKSNNNPSEVGYKYTAIISAQYRPCLFTSSSCTRKPAFRAVSFELKITFQRI